LRLPFGFQLTRRQPARRNFWAAAQGGRLTHDWNASLLTTTQDTQIAGPILRARSRDLARNDPYAAKFLKMVVSNVVGDVGVLMQPKLTKLRGSGFRDTLNTQLSDAWRRWCKKENASCNQRYSFKDLQRLVMRTLALDGEFLIYRDRTAGNPFSYALGMMDVDQIDHAYNVNLVNGVRVRMGLEFDAQGRFLAIYIREKLEEPVFIQRKRIALSDLIFEFIPERAGQLRGIPWMTPCAFQMQMLKGYAEAEQVAARVAAAKSGFFKSAVDAEYKGEGDEKNADGSFVMDAQPGLFEALPPGMEFQPWDPKHPNTTYGEFQKASLRGIAAGLGVSYVSLGNDLEATSYSSVRAGMLEERDLWFALQQFFIEHFHQVVFSDWLKMASLTGEVSVPGSDYEDVEDQIEWRPRGFDWVDPQKDAEAAIMMVNNGFSSFTDECARRGVDFEDLLKRLDKDMKALKAVGIDLPIGLAQTAKAGAAASPSAGGTAGEEGGTAPTATAAAGGKPNGKASTKGDQLTQ
jgi:lambda family phage portal protein